MLIANLFFNLDLVNCAAACFLSYLLRESREYFLDKTSSESKNNQPRIVIVGTDFTTYHFIILWFYYLFLILIYIEKE